MVVGRELQLNFAAAASQSVTRVTVTIESFTHPYRLSLR